ncbi:MAG: ATP-binding protein [Bacteroidales bacterium]|nr:ATP-binding protein [Bacteroidales bacterium]
MILKQQIIQVIDNQIHWLRNNDRGILREQRETLKAIPGFATIITGIRRCGKSTLLMQLMSQHPQRETLYLNFEDIHLIGFNAGDFRQLHDVITERKAQLLFFDEIQLVNGWELFIHQILREGYLVYITGSNASMLSVELGTNLTGRHLSFELFPFSYKEFLQFTRQRQGEKSFVDYLKKGGLPEYLANLDTRIPATMLDDILVRDIAIRHSLRNMEPLKRLALYLLTNTANLFSGNRLVSIVDNGITTSTILEYIDYMRDAYIIDTIGQYSTNMRATTRNPKKAYAFDTGLSHAVNLSGSDDLGHLLENYQFLQLRKRAKDHIFYYKGQGECDFVVTGNNNTPQELYQVCLNLTNENLNREIGGLREAMRELHVAEGHIVTLGSSDTLTVEEGVIKIGRAY